MWDAVVAAYPCAPRRNPTVLQRCPLSDKAAYAPQQEPVSLSLGRA